MTEQMDDRELMQEIARLVEREHELLQKGEHGGGLGSPEHKALGDAKVELDRLWDLLRQRRAKRHSGVDPNTAVERDANTVERYQQ